MRKNLRESRKNRGKWMRSIMIQSKQFVKGKSVKNEKEKSSENGKDDREN